MITVSDLAEAVLAAVDGVDRFHYTGVSLGGAIGLWLGVHHPDRLRSLAVMATAAQFPGPAASLPGGLGRAPAGPGPPGAPGPPFGAH
jgi:3-oxoadipate enol-lactonase/4-carboxymuconolactone decarboxylase